MQEGYKWSGKKIGGESGGKIANGIFNVADIGLSFISVGGAVKHLTKLQKLNKVGDKTKYLVKQGSNGVKKVLTTINPKTLYNAVKDKVRNVSNGRT